MQFADARDNISTVLALSAVQTYLIPAYRPGERAATTIGSMRLQGITSGRFTDAQGAALDAIGIIAEKDSSNAPLQYNNYRLGAVGGWGGDHFEDNELSRAARLIRIAVRASCYVDYVQFSYAETGQPSVLGEKHGGNGISCNRSGGIISQEQAIDLASDGTLIGLQGRASEYVNHIEFVTDKRIFDPFPDTGEGHPFSLLLPRDSSLKIRRLFGRSGDTLDAVGVIVE